MLSAIYPATSQYVVRYNKRSLAFSLLLMCNLVSMPLKAYLSEPFPWEREPPLQIPSDCYTNYTQCAPFVLKFFQNQSHDIPPNKLVLTTQAFDLYKISFPLVPSDVQDPEDYVWHLPHAIFFTKEQNRQAMAVARRQCKVSDLQSGAFYRFFGIVIAQSALWAVEDTNENILYIGQSLAQLSKEWLLFKFFFRLLLSVYIAWYMWKNYYRHYLHLARNLSVFGIPRELKVDHYEIVVGDPTSIILLNPVVSALFVIDFWMSVDFVSRVLLRIEQLVGITQFFFAYLYLSRTVWMAYGSLSSVSYLLKKIHCERYFRGVDPTWTAIVVAIMVGPFTYFQTHMPWFAKFYNILLTFTVHDERLLEATLAATLYVFTIGTLPVLFGFLPLQWFTRKLCRTRLALRKAPSLSPASYLSNNIKNRWVLQLSFFSFKNVTILTEGGAVYKLFQHDCKYKRHLGISERGADCYIKWKSGPNEATCLRLSLLACIDIQPPLRFEFSPQPRLFGTLEIISGSVKLVQGSNASPWI